MLKVICNNPYYGSVAEALASRLNVVVDTNLELELLPKNIMVLIFDNNGVSLRCIDDQKTGAVFVDFIHGKLGYRLSHNEAKPLIAKAVGIKPGITPLVWDMTAGLGQDAFILAKLGCRVHMHERNAVVHCLLSDGLMRAKKNATESDNEVLRQVIDRLTLFSIDAYDVLSPSQNTQLISDGNSNNNLGVSLKKPNVVYLDPMFPDRKKTAKVKKGMQLFHQLIGADDDADTLLELALDVAESRVVVKRPKGAPVLAGQKPSLQFDGKTLRFDVYPLKKMEKLDR